MGYRRILGILDGKRALITGAGQGLGHSYAIFMAREGASIVANDIDGPAAAQTVREIETAGGKAIPHTGNIGHWDTAKEAVQLSISTFGSIDVVVNNAGITHEAELKDETEEHLDSILETNLKGTFAVAYHAVHQMMTQGSGSIVNVTSGAQAGHSGRSAYSASKGAVAGFTFAWAQELAPHGIRVNAISPTAQTRMSEPLPPGSEPPALRRPENVAPLVAYLSSDEASHVTGQVLRLNRDVLSLFSPPRPGFEAIHEEAWTLEAIRQHFGTTIGMHLEPIGVTAQGYMYQDGVS